MKNAQKGSASIALIVVIVLLAIGAGYYLYTRESTDIETDPQISRTPVSKKVTLEQLQTAQIPMNGGTLVDTKSDIATGTVTLNDGRHTITKKEVDACIGASSESCFIQLETEKTGITYVERNGTSYALVVLGSVLDGTGHFYHIAAFKHTGDRAEFVASQYIGDRTPPQSIHEVDGVITVDFLTRLEGKPATATYQFTGDKFVEAR